MAVGSGLRLTCVGCVPDVIGRSGRSQAGFGTMVLALWNRIKLGGQAEAVLWAFRLNRALPSCTHALNAHFVQIVSTGVPVDLWMLTLGV